MKVNPVDESHLHTEFTSTRHLRIYSRTDCQRVCTTKINLNQLFYFLQSRSKDFGFMYKKSRRCTAIVNGNQRTTQEQELHASKSDWRSLSLN